MNLAYYKISSKVVPLCILTLLLHANVNKSGIIFYNLSYFDMLLDKLFDKTLLSY